MLRSLFIQNYALIRELNIDFNPGLTIISGETGAGKSIMLGALSLILGQRADTNVLFDKTRKCIVEGIFDIREYNLVDFFKNNDLDFEPQTTLRREINVAGKSRAFINDTPVNLNVLKDLGMQLVDIHSRHQNILLGNNLFQLQVVDTFEGNFPLLEDYKKNYQIFRSLESEYTFLKEKNEKAQSDLDYFQFQLEQLEKAKLMEGEQGELEDEQNMLTHAEDISIALERISSYLDGDQDNVLRRMKDIRTLLGKLKQYYSQAEEIYERFESVDIELKDLSSEIESSKQDIEYKPGRLELVRERLNLIYSLEQKHHVKTVDELIKIKTELVEAIERIISGDSRLEKTKLELEDKRVNLERMGRELSVKRINALPSIEKNIIELLKQLGMPNGRFAIRHSAIDHITPVGCDHVDFMFSSSKHSDLLDLKKVASGGELSRVMLSLKSLITKSVSMPTIIFDEIDSGVSGDIADRVGGIISDMSKNMQVINITHLPQIASKGGHHYLVYKLEEKAATQTHIRLLNFEERILEIAKMLSGQELTSAAVENAKVLLKHLDN